MTHADWLERYRRAWIERDAETAATLFTEDAIYRGAAPLTSGVGVPVVQVMPGSMRTLMSPPSGTT